MVEGPLLAWLLLLLLLLVGAAVDDVGADDMLGSLWVEDVGGCDECVWPLVEEVVVVVVLVEDDDDEDCALVTAPSEFDWLSVAIFHSE